MQKTILITGATDGIGLATARQLVQRGQRVLVHGRSAKKLRSVEKALTAAAVGGDVETYLADLSRLDEVDELAKNVSAGHSHLDVLINNAGVFKMPEPVTPEGLDVRFVVNTIAPWVLTQRLLPLFNSGGRIVNLSSAAQSPVSLAAFEGKRRLSDFDAYAQSKLALTMWSNHLARELGDEGPAVIAVNPGSLLATKMVKEAFGSSRAGVDVGAQILVRAALDDAFANASGQYFDNDAGTFADPHPNALDDGRCRKIVEAIEAAVAQQGVVLPG